MGTVLEHPTGLFQGRLICHGPCATKLGKGGFDVVMKPFDGTLRVGKPVR